MLRLFPATPRRATAWVALPVRRRRGRRCSALLREHAGAHLTTFELVNRQALDLVLAHLPGARDPLAEPHPWYGLVELAGAASDDGLDDAAGGASSARPSSTTWPTDAVVAGSPAQRVGAVGAARGDLGGAEGRGRDASSTT